MKLFEERRKKNPINFASGFCVCRFIRCRWVSFDVCSIENWSKHFHVYTIDYDYGKCRQTCWNARIDFLSSIEKKNYTQQLYCLGKNCQCFKSHMCVCCMDFTMAHHEYPNHNGYFTVFSRTTSCGYFHGQCTY